MPGTPRTDPSVRNYRTELLPRVRRAVALSDKGAGYGVAVAVVRYGVVSIVPQQD